jgi:predicted signal transduction protein with EAL and GGDEF domain
VTVSVGVATASPRPPIDVDELIATADEALYEAKRAGKNAVRAAEVRGYRFASSPRVSDDGAGTGAQTANIGTGRGARRPSG